MRDDYYDPHDSDMMYRIHELESDLDFWKARYKKLENEIIELRQILTEAGDVIRTTSEAVDYWRSQYYKLLNSY